MWSVVKQSLTDSSGSPLFDSIWRVVSFNEVSDSFQSQCSSRLGPSPPVYTQVQMGQKWITHANSCSLFIFPSLLILMSLVACLDSGGVDSRERRG